MKKILLLICSLMTLLFSLLQAFAGAYHFDVLNYSEKKQIEKVWNKVITIINNHWWCEWDVYTKVYHKVVAKVDNFVPWSRMKWIYSYLQYMFDNQWNGCVWIEDQMVMSVLDDIEEVAEKKWTFKKMIWADIEARQNSMYTYFYHNDILINTIENKVKNDEELIFGNDYPYPDNYLHSIYAMKKLDLYAWIYLNWSRDILLFSKKVNDGGVLHYIYNTKTLQWQRLSWIYDIKNIKEGVQWIFILWDNGRLMQYNKVWEIVNIVWYNTSKIQDFLLGLDGEIKLLYRQDSELYYLQQ